MTLTWSQVFHSTGIEELIRRDTDHSVRVITETAFELVELWFRTMQVSSWLSCICLFSRPQQSIASEFKWFNHAWVRWHAYKSTPTHADYSVSLIVAVLDTITNSEVCWNVYIVERCHLGASIFEIKNVGYFLIYYSCLSCAMERDRISG